MSIFRVVAAAGFVAVLAFGTDEYIWHPCAVIIIVWAVIEGARWRR